MYHFVERLGAGGFGVVYLAEDRATGKPYKTLNYQYFFGFAIYLLILTIYLGDRYAVKALQKSKIKDYDTFQNEIRLLKTLVRFVILLMGD